MTTLARALRPARARDLAGIEALGLGVPLSFSISAGIGCGIIGYAAVKAVRGKAREVPLLSWILVPLFVGFFASPRLERQAS